MTNAITTRSKLLAVYVSVVTSKLKQQGLIWLSKRLAYRLRQELGWLLFLPFAVLMHVLGYRRVTVRVEHIGHLATEVDTFLKAQQLNLLPKKRYFILAPPHKVSNPHLLNYWRPHIRVVENPVFCFLLEMVTRHYFARSNSSLHAVSFFGTQEIYRINQLWGNRPPVLALNAADKNWAEQALIELGIPKHTWFVCMHVREGGFLPHNESIQAHRNASIDNAMLAMEEIVRRGGVVIRMGDPTMKKLSSFPGIIDYAHHPLKSDRMDVVLCAKAKFFFGCTSGLAFLSAIFGVPVAHANMIPMETLGIRPGDISIPKLLWSNQHNRYLTFKEVMASDIGGYFFTHQYTQAGIRADENTPQELCDLAQEMLDRLENKWTIAPSDTHLHAQFMTLFRPGHYSYGAASAAGILFLRQHQDLLR